MDAQATRIYTAIVIASIVLGVIIVYFIISIIRQQQRNLQLHKLNILAEITALEKERARIASDLHDEMGPMLSAVKLMINSFYLSEADDQVQLKKTNEHIDNMIARLREISFDLMPNTLIRKGLIMALKEYVDYINIDNKIKIHFNTTDPIELSEQKAINIYRIVQEILLNSLKHSKATELTLSLTEKHNKIILSSLDNGIGFDHTKELKENIGFGLRNIVSRTEIMEGELFLESGKGKGTTYIIEIPKS